MKYSELEPTKFSEWESLQDDVKSKYRFGKRYDCYGNILTICNSSTVPIACFANSCRNRVTEFSVGSAKRMSRYLRSCRAEYTAMYTLTYPCGFPSNGVEVKKHLKEFLRRLKRTAVTNGFDQDRYSAFWFLEFQERGAPHFHIFCNYYERNKQWISKQWYEIVGSEDHRHMLAGTRVERIRSGRGGTASYAKKYAQKQEQKIVPNGYDNVGRFWGISGDRSVVSATTFVDVNAGKDSKVKKQKESIDKTINKAIKDGYCRVIKEDVDMLVYIFDETRPDIIAILMGKIMLLPGERVTHDVEEELDEGVDF